MHGLYMQSIEALQSGRYNQVCDLLGDKVRLLNNPNFSDDNQLDDYYLNLLCVTHYIIACYNLQNGNIDVSAAHKLLTFVQEKANMGEILYQFILGYYYSLIGDSEQTCVWFVRFLENREQIPACFHKIRVSQTQEHALKTLIREFVKRGDFQAVYYLSQYEELTKGHNTPEATDLRRLVKTTFGREDQPKQNKFLADLFRAIRGIF